MTSVLCTEPAIRAAAALIWSRPIAEAILLRRNDQGGDHNFDKDDNYDKDNNDGKDDNYDMLLTGCLDAY